MALGDAQLAIRSLRKSPGFVVLAVLSLGLGVGLVTTAAGMLDAVVHPYVPFSSPSRLYRIVGYGDGSSHTVRGYEKYAALVDAGRFFEGVAALSPGGDTVPVEAGGVGGGVAYVTPNFFDVVGVTPRIGRTFSSTDGRRVEEQGVVISYELWRSAFAGWHSLAGARVAIGVRSYTVVGVVPPGVAINGWEPSAWLPMSPSDLKWPYQLEPIVRLRRGQTQANARAELNILASRLRAEYGTGYRPFGFEILPFLAPPVQVQGLQLAVGSAALAVLLITCSNLASLMLARAFGKRREQAVRVALGATPTRALRPMLAEGTILVLTGGVVGFIAAMWGIDVISFRGTLDPVLREVFRAQLSPRVLGLAVAATALSLMLSAFLPALRLSHPDLSTLLKDGAWTNTRRSLGLNSGLVVVEIVFTMVLLMAAGLLIKAARRMSQYDFGYDADHVWIAYARPPVLSRGGTSPALVAEFDNARRQLLVSASSVAGVLSVASFSEARTERGAVSSEEGNEGRQVNEQRYYVVSPSFLRTLGVRLQKGRDFQPGDLTGGAAIVDARIAETLWPRGYAVGHLIKLGDLQSAAPSFPVVGVAKQATLTFDADPDVVSEPPIFVVSPPRDVIQVQLLVRLDRDNARLLQRVLFALSSSLPGGHVTVAPWLGSFRTAVSERRFISGIFGTLGLVGLLLSAFGLYGVLSQSVAQRRNEFAVRVALGATSRDVIKTVLRDCAVISLAGAGIGAIAALWMVRLLGAVLYTVSPTDATSLVAAELVLLLGSTMAGIFPALAAARGDPLRVLRN